MTLSCVLINARDGSPPADLFPVDQYVVLCWIWHVFPAVRWLVVHVNITHKLALAVSLLFWFEGLDGGGHTTQALNLIHM